MFKFVAAALPLLLLVGVLQPTAQQEGARSVWEGVYTPEQAERGKAVYSGVCAKCHGRTGNGAGDPDQPESPSVARMAFLERWDGLTLGELFEKVRTTMPADNPKSRADQEYIDAIAHMLDLSGIPSGAEELAPDAKALSQIVILPVAPQ